MLTIEEGQDLMIKFIELRDRAKETGNHKDKLEFLRHEELCVKKFTYLITMSSSRYKAFSNYDDLNQEGMLALVKAMKNYDPKKGNFFWWGHRYIGTRIARSANLHTTIRFPLKVAKELSPHKEAIMPLVVEESNSPEENFEVSEMVSSLKEATKSLTEEQQNVISLMYGFEGNKPLSINKICKQLGMSRSLCIKTVNTSLSMLKDKIKI